MNEPAFPVDPSAKLDETLRDYFAAKAMQSFLQGNPQDSQWMPDSRGKDLTAWVAGAAYDYADAMMEARKK